MRLIADLHLHSKYSRATSREMDVENMARWCKIKGITIVGTGDFTHPVWLRELKAKLKPTDRGLYTHAGVHFMLTVEVSNIYPQGGRLRKIHNILFCPSFEIAERINAVLGRFGSLMADGRPTLTVPSDKMVEYIMEVSPDCMVVPTEAKAAGNRCPVCKRPVTVGVMHRVEDLADREAGYVPTGVTPYRNLIPLEEIIAGAMGAQVGTSGVREEYFKLCARLGSEFAILLDVPADELARHTTARIVEGVRRVREGQVEIKPGYDGTYGEIRIFGAAAGPAVAADAKKKEEPAQTTLF